ncbi:MAG: hypothetical protein WBO15_13710 [Gammaproteobacteria bacterium]
MTDKTPHTWPELAADLYDRLTQRNAELAYEFDNVEVLVPSAVTDQANHAPWRIHGTLKIRSRDLGTA